MRCYSLFLLAAAVFLAGLPSVAMAGRHYDENHCVDSVALSLDELVSRKAEPFRMRTTQSFPTGTMRPPLGLVTGAFMRHLQGVTRLQGTRTLVMSGNAKGGAYLYVARMKSQPEEGPWTSNVKCRIGQKLCSSPSDDTIERIIPLGGAYPHPGGLDSFGDFVVVGTDIRRGKPSIVRFFDFRKPLAPVELKHLQIARSGIRADSVAAVKLRSGKNTGRFLVAATAHAKDKVTFYLSTSGDLLDTTTRFEKVSEWKKDGTHPFSRYQGIQFVYQCDGSLYLFGSFKTKPMPGIPYGGDDRLDSYFVWPDMPGSDGPWLEAYRNDVLKTDKSFFSAGVGVYVDDHSRRLMVYSTDYWPLNPLKRDTVLRFDQFR